MDAKPCILDLGCGTTKVPGAIGLDVIPLVGVDVVGDLAERPYAFADSSFDAVYLNDVIEHIPNTIKTMEEVYRVLKPNGRAFIRVVNWNSIYTAMDPTHLAAFTENSFDFFGKRIGRSYYSTARFDVIRVKRGYNLIAQRFCPNERLLYFFSHFLSNVLEDLHFELRAVKPEGAAVEVSTSAIPVVSLLRCPVALSEGKTGTLKLVHDCWLISEETGCKYPIANNVPVITRKEGQRWAKIPTDKLPVPPQYDFVTVEYKSIDSIAEDVEPFRPIEWPGEFWKEFFLTYASLAIGGICHQLKRVFWRLPLKILRLSWRGIKKMMAWMTQKRSEANTPSSIPEAAKDTSRAA